ncbi:uncharacterized protein PgNI_03576 [Pyricularia grisea]|uniref:U1-C C2H2-type zinc finger domain-containing protein n=1 Tax=Pyricularia grisea TaxID=148305 RepID=A0A6P8BBI0_PYRGI|nr:uncharacterized protein PgNI_03576 [Pyricularia grisea]TLD13057.1 hypothetical protein PgNI_03576 [Pyricularia grisea]
MAEYWKSTPRYWCKHCSMYVRDTKLERTNHEATGKHRGAVERALRDLHRGHEKQEKEKERARREIERLNGVVAGGDGDNKHKSGRSGAPGRAPPQEASSSSSSREQRQAQLEQLAGMGVNIPDELRGQMAMAGEWTVTKTRVIDDGEGNESVARGVRKRELEKTEEEKEEENAVNGLFKKPRRWGMDTRIAGGDDGGELDALLSGSSFVVKGEKKEEEEESAESRVKVEDTEKGPDLEQAQQEDKPNVVKEEEDVVKKEPADEPSAPHTAAELAAPAVVFKKRKPKNIRQK